MTIRRHSAGSGKKCRPSGAWSFWLFLLTVLLAPAPPAGAGERARVLEVIDGDTLLVRSDRDVRTIRLIGIDAPEKGHPAKPREFWSGESARALSNLCEGKEVLLEPDREDTDPYGRSLRYVFLDGPDRTLLNLDQVRNGHARVLRRFPFSRRGEFERAEKEARKNGRGIWRDGGMAEIRWLREGGAEPVRVYPAGGDALAVVYGDFGKPAVPPGELGWTIRRILRIRAENAAPEFATKAEREGFRPLGTADPRTTPPLSRPDAGEAPDSPGKSPEDGAAIPWDRAHAYVGREVTVEGKIVRTHRGKDILFLNFHPNWRKYVTVVVFGKDLPAFPAEPETYYRGRKVRVRGTVTLYGERPEIVVTSPSAITVVGEPAD